MKALLIIASLSTAGVLLPALPALAHHHLTQQPSAATEQAPEEDLDFLSKLTEKEQARLTKPNEKPNNRAKHLVKIAAIRLQNARRFLDQGKPDEADEQLTIYTALINHAGNYLKSSVKVRDKAHKTMEQGLRQQLRQLEGIRRDSFAGHFDYADKAVKTAERVRLQSLRLALGAEGILKNPRNQP